MDERQKGYVTQLLLENACELAERAHHAHHKGLVDDEVRLSIGAHLLAALALEGAINEVGESLLGTWLCQRIERAAPPLKWLVVSKFTCDEAFQPDREPLQTVQCLHQKRNRIAHPKAVELGGGITIGHADGRVDRDVPLDTPLASGDHIYVGFEKLLDEFNSSTAQKAARRSVAALRELRNRTHYSGLPWLEDTAKRFPWLIQ